jgi:hypothetical protein
MGALALRVADRGEAKNDVALALGGTLMSAHLRSSRDAGVLWLCRAGRFVPLVALVGLACTVRDTRQTPAESAAAASAVVVDSAPHSAQAIDSVTSSPAKTPPVSSGTAGAPAAAERRRRAARDSAAAANANTIIGHDSVIRRNPRDTRHQLPVVRDTAQHL